VKIPSELDHPCKETCSGWQQGKERGIQDVKDDPTKYGLVSMDKVSGLVNALEFYNSRTVYEKLQKFPGDDRLSECNSVAEDAIADWQKLKGEG